MALFNFNFGKKAVEIPEPKASTHPVTGELMFNFAAMRPELPTIRENKKNDWVDFGDNNLYPEDLIEYLNTSAIHSAIVENKAKLQAGKGILLNNTADQAASDAFLASLPIDQQTLIKRIIDTPNGSESLQEILGKLALDWQVFGALALEVIWSIDFTRIAEIKHIPVSKIRAGKMCDGEVKEYFYSRNWAKWKQEQFKPRCIQTFDQRTPQLYKDHVADSACPAPCYNQIIYMRHVVTGLEYYGEPLYRSALSWIKVDSQMGLFHLSNIENSFAPAMYIKMFNTRDYTPEQKQMIVQSLKLQHGGAHNAGKAMIMFCDDKDSAPEIEPINVPDLDKMFLALADQAVQQIVIGHGVTSPALVGVAMPGRLGFSTELESSYKIFESQVVGPERQILEKLIQKLFKANGIDIPVHLAQFNPLA